jgi:hypothetical protein
MDHQPTIVDNPLGENFLFRGGDKGGDGVILLHANSQIQRPQIGLSGLYEGGWSEVLEICKSSSTTDQQPQQQEEAGTMVHGYKAFFNYW